MDPITLAIGLGIVFGHIAGRAADVTLGKGLELLIEHGAEKAKLNESQARALDEALTAARSESDAQVGTRLGRALNKVKDNDALAARVAAAVVEMTSSDLQRVPSDLLDDLDLTEAERQPFARFLYTLRGKLVSVPTYGDGIRYADGLHQRGLLEGLYEVIRGVVGQADGQAFLWVQQMPPDTRAVELPYLDYLRQEFEAPGMDSRSKDKAAGEPARLERVYIALNTTEARLVRVSEEEQMRRGPAGPVGAELTPTPLSALRAALQSRRLVLLGHPGSGKSTFAEHLCLCLATARAATTESVAAQWLAELKSDDVDQWALDAYFPILIRLRAFAADMESLPDDAEGGHEKHLIAFLKRQFESQGFPGLFEHAIQLLNAGKAFVVFDGLDEVRHPKLRTPLADAGRRAIVAQAVQRFCLMRFREARALLTCRIRQYRNADGTLTEWAVALERWPAFSLADFDWTKARQFVEHWFSELHARGRQPDAQAKISELLRVFDTNPRLRELTGKPIVLTQMAIVHAVHDLPGSRVEVYVECAELLLWEWEILKARLSQRRETAEAFLNSLVPGLSPESIRKALDEAVFYAHAEGEAEVSGERLRTALARAISAHTGSPAITHTGDAQMFIDGWLRDRNGLLVPATGDDSFDSPHPTLREFMAGRYLHENRIRNTTTDVRERWDVGGPRLFRSDADRWREVFRFAAGLEDSREEVADALNRLCPREPSLDRADIERLLLAAEVTADVGRDILCHEDNAVGQQVYERMQTQLVCLMRDTEASQPYPNDSPRLTPPDILLPVTRLAAGSLLNNLGWTPHDLDTLQYIEHAPSEGFWISKYLVTNLQYQRFLSAADYADKTIWQRLVRYDADGNIDCSVGDAAWKWFCENGSASRRPRWWDSPRLGVGRHLFPVGGVTWFEAAAYCVWFTRHWRTFVHMTSLPEDVTFRLPREFEWEAAAGGGASNRFAWQTTPEDVSDEEIQLYANTAESNLKGSTPVVMYPAGASPAGVIDLCGNMWEWQANLYENGEPYLAQRGGSSQTNRYRACVAYRQYHVTFDVPRNDGFRVIAERSKSTT